MSAEKYTPLFPLNRVIAGLLVQVYLAFLMFFEVHRANTVEHKNWLPLTPVSFLYYLTANVRMKRFQCQAQHARKNYLIAALTITGVF